MKNEFWRALCFNCGWSGSSEKLDGGGPIVDTGDYDDLYCPVCESDDVEEKSYFRDLTLKEKIRLIFRRITFYGYRFKRRNNKAFDEYLKEQDYDEVMK